MTIPQTPPRRSRPLLIAAIALLLLAALTLATYLATRPGEIKQNSYTPPPRDALAADASGFDSNLPTLSAGEYSVSIQPDMRVDDNGNCEIWFRNPESNPCHLMLDVRLAESGLLIYRTGLVAPGEGIRAVQFVPDALSAMMEGEQEVQLTVRSLRLGDYVNLGDVNLNTRLTYSP